MKTYKVKIEIFGGKAVAYKVRAHNEAEAHRKAFEIYLKSL